MRKIYPAAFQNIAILDQAGKPAAAFRPTPASTLAPVAGADHFSVLETLADPAGVLARETAALARRVTA